MGKAGVCDKNIAELYNIEPAELLLWYSKGHAYHLLNLRGTAVVLVCFISCKPCRRSGVQLPSVIAELSHFMHALGDRLREHVNRKAERMNPLDTRRGACEQGGYCLHMFLRIL
jgi:hypothetical protein